MSQEHEGPWKGSLSSRCLSQVNAWKQAARESQAFKMEEVLLGQLWPRLRARQSVCHMQVCWLCSTGLMWKAPIFWGGCLLSGQWLMVAFSHGMPPPPHQWVLLITRDILSFPVCSNSFRRPYCPPKTAHHILLPASCIYVLSSPLTLCPGSTHNCLPTWLTNRVTLFNHPDYMNRSELGIGTFITGESSA